LVAVRKIRKTNHETTAAARIRNSGERYLSPILNEVATVDQSKTEISA
jgi:hypothetical protein